MRSRIFQNHVIRKELHIEPMWDFTTLDEEEKPLNKYRMLVPSCIESNRELTSYKGKGIYSKRITFGGNIRFVFKGVSHTAFIYLDKKQIGYHYNA